MSNFEKAIVGVLEDEGGYVNHPHDPGGETKYGISKRSYPDVDIKNLTVDQAKAIYLRDFWKPGPYDAIFDDAFAAKLFNTAINVGPKRAYRFAQQAVNRVGGNLVADGVIGPKSIAQINSVHPQKLIDAFRSIQAEYYNDLVKADPRKSVFIRGWLARAER
jgi:lysozyme family protein